MEREFILGNFNTWLDWRLILTEKSVTPPEAKTNYVSLDGMDGTLDLSEALTGDIKYNDRTVTASFIATEGTRNERADLLRNIRNSLHGRKVVIVEPDDPAHYFVGRVSITDETNLLPYATVSLQAVCEPWRYCINKTVRYIEVTSSTSKDVIIHNNGSKVLNPEIKVTGSIAIKADGVESSLTDGTYKISNLRLNPGLTDLLISGDGSVTLTYREADL